MSSSLRLVILEDGAEVDLSSSYFNFQIKGLLEKEKNITIKAFAFDSPGLHITNSSSLSGVEKASRDDILFRATRVESTGRSLRAKRSISLPAPIPLFDESDDEDDAEQQQTIMLPLERYEKNKQKAVDDIQRLLKTKKQELASCENKIRLASQQNAENETAVNLTTCGKCHLKLGHTKKRCNFSPCKSAYLCGFLSKHVSEKIKISNLQREVAKLEGNLSTAQNEIQNAEML